MKAENRKYSITYHDGSKEIIIGTHNLPPQSQVRSVSLIKDPNPSQNTKNGSERLSERKYIVKYPDGTETLITGFHNLPDKTSVSAIYRVREDAPNTADTASEYLCFADFEYTCGGMANDIDFDGYSLETIGGTNNPFSGNFNGNGYRIKNAKMISSSPYTIGLFGEINNANISNIIVDSISFDGSIKQTSIGVIAKETIDNFKRLMAVASLM